MSSIFKSITKYTKLLDPNSIKYELEYSYTWQHQVDQGLSY